MAEVYIMTDAVNMTLTSSAFADGGQIPRKYSGEGRDVSPPLSWTDSPDGTRELAMIVDDPDAPTAQPWVHWVIYKIPAGTTALSEAIAATAELVDPPGARQGKNSWPTIGYRGPMPPPGHGTHHYHFKLYALNIQLDLSSEADKQDLAAAMTGHILAEAELVGTYER